MSADVWKVEYHVTEPGEASPSHWTEDRAEALGLAKPGGKIERVTSYLDDREVIFPADDE